LPSINEILIEEGEFTMALFMVQFTYTSEAWAAMTKNPQDRTIPSRDLVQKLGGKLLGLYYSLGKYDGMALFEVPDDISASAVGLAVKAAGDMKVNKTTRLFTMDEALEAMRKAGSSSYSVPTR
jgi:uncharacterized protein with GYD domain